MYQPELGCSLAARPELLVFGKDALIQGDDVDQLIEVYQAGLVPTILCNDAATKHIADNDRA